MTVTQDNSVFIQRAINNVQEHALVGGILVVLIIFAFLRDFRSTLIVCTSIPVSVIGTFALLYFGGFTLNTMTFGGLALGIGMIVDAAIVVLENTHRHLHMGKDKMTAAIDGSEEVWSAILASTLTHIAVFVPLLFLSGTASIMFTQLSVVVMFSLAMSLFVAVTIVPVLCSRWLKTPDEEAAHGHHGALLRHERAVPRADGRELPQGDPPRPEPPADGDRRRRAGRRRGLIYPQIGIELMPQADEGEVNVNAELAVGTRIERTEEALLKLEEMVKSACRKRGRSSPRAAAAATTGRAAAAAGDAPRPDPRHARAARSAHAHQRRDRDRAAPELSGTARRGRSRQPAGGNNQIMRFLSGGGTTTTAARAGCSWRFAATISTTLARRAGRARDDGRHRRHRRRQHRPRGRPSRRSPSASIVPKARCSA